MKQKKADSHSGFTLLEMMVVVAIITVSVGLALPNLMAWLPNYRLKNAARDMISFMQQAKMEAIKTNTSLTIFFDDSETPGFYYLELDGLNGYTGGDRRINFSDYKSGVDFGSGSAKTNWSGNNPDNRGSVLFSSRGMSFGSGTIYIENENEDVCYAITVQATGSIKLWQWTGSRWQD